MSRAGAVWRECWGDLHEDLVPRESAYIAPAVPKRVAEFRTVRRLARAALAEFGVPRPSMVPGFRGEPVWPLGLVGAMTHCSGYRAVLVARMSAFMSVGIDAEPNIELPERVLARIASQRECEAVTAMSRRRPDVCADRLLFSAKEAVYKAWFPRERTLLDFDQAEVALHTDGSFVAVISEDAPRAGSGRPVPLRMSGHWDVVHGVLRTRVLIPADAEVTPHARPSTQDHVIRAGGIP